MMNHTTRTYPRTSREAFGLDATEANPIQIYRTPLHKRALWALWALMRHGWIAIVVALAAVVLTGCSADMRHEHTQASALAAAQQEEAAKASRDFAGQAVCGPGAQAQWLDDKTLTCQPKRGKSYSVAGVKP